MGEEKKGNGGERRGVGGEEEDKQEEGKRGLRRGDILSKAVLRALTKHLGENTEHVVCAMDEAAAALDNIRCIFCGDDLSTPLYLGIMDGFRSHITRITSDVRENGLHCGRDHEVAGK